MSSIPYYKCHRPKDPSIFKELATDVHGYFFRADDYKDHEMVIAEFDGVLVHIISHDGNGQCAYSDPIYIFHDESFFDHCNTLQNGTFELADESSIEIKHQDVRFHHSNGGYILSLGKDGSKPYLWLGTHPEIAISLIKQGFTLRSYYRNCDGMVVDVEKEFDSIEELAKMYNKIRFYSYYH